MHIELYVRWMQEVRRLKPSTVSRRISVVAGFYRTCVIDQVLPTSPADYVRRPNVPPESPTLGLSHLQFEAMLAAARDSANRNDFALVTMLGLLGLRIFEACGTNIADLGEEHGHRVLKIRGRGGKVVLTPLPPAVAGAVERTIASRACGRERQSRRCGLRRPAAGCQRCRRPRRTPGCAAARVRTGLNDPGNPTAGLRHVPLDQGNRFRPTNQTGRGEPAALRETRADGSC